MKMDCASNKIFDFVFNPAFQQWVRNDLPLSEFCPISELEIMEEAAVAIRSLDHQKITFSDQAIERNYNIILNNILFD
jgi:hypothetical protein